MDMFEALAERLAGDTTGLRLLAELEQQFDDLAFTVDELESSITLDLKELSAA